MLVAYAVDRIALLGQLSGRQRLRDHALVMGLLQEMERDGYSPDAMSVGRTRLDHYLGSKCPVAKSVLQHPIWKYMQFREVPKDAAAWMAKQLAAHKLLRLEDTDEIHAETLGLMPSLRGSYENDEERTPLPEWEGEVPSFESLDGLMLLVLMLREAEDRGISNYVAILRRHLRTNAAALGNRHFSWHPEALDTWRFLFETRLATWIPDSAPTPADEKKAWEVLAKEFEDAPDKRGRAASPRTLTQGRSERRWRRRAWVRAAAQAAVASGYADYTYVNERHDLSWLIANRELIGKHIERAACR